MAALAVCERPVEVESASLIRRRQRLYRLKAGHLVLVLSRSAKIS